MPLSETYWSLVYLFQKQKQKQKQKKEVKFVEGQSMEEGRQKVFKHFFKPVKMFQAHLFKILK